MDERTEAKRMAAERAADAVRDGMVVGLGTGSTAHWAIRRIGGSVRDGLDIRAVATSVQSEKLAAELGIRLVSFSDIDGIDVTIDGADEVDGSFHLIKGGGGALLREKIVAASSRQLIVVVDESKLVGKLGDFPLPVEIVPFAHELSLRKLRGLGCDPELRMTDGKRYVTDNGNYIADCAFGTIADPGRLHDEINAIPGVVDNGLFIGMAGRVIVGCRDGTVKELEKSIPFGSSRKGD